MKRLTSTARAARAFLGAGPYENGFIWRGRPVRLGNRGPGAPMGYHGGGWDREFGVRLGRRGWKGTVIVYLGRGSIRIDPAK